MENRGFIWKKVAASEIKEGDEFLCFNPEKPKLPKIEVATTTWGKGKDGTYYFASEPKIRGG